MILDYNNRIKILDNVIKKIYYKFFNIGNEDNYKFYILCFLHYFCLSLFYISILFINNTYYLYIIILILIIQICLNFYDNGCFIMKLERKYIGKHWYGPYTILNAISPGTINKNSIYYIFNTISIICILILINKFYNKNA
jgi:hypothetical protein